MKNQEIETRIVQALGEIPPTFTEVIASLSAGLSTYVTAKEEFDAIQRRVNENQREVDDILRLYEQTRLQRLKQLMEENNQDWCSYDSHLAFPKGEISLLYIITRVDDRDTGKVERTRIVSVCPKCYRRARERHGWNDGYWSCYYAHEAERREDGIYYNEFGEWKKIFDQRLVGRSLHSIDLHYLPSKVPEDWRLPPAMKLDYKSGHPVLMIGENKLRLA